MHRDAPARALWRDVTAVANDNRVEEVLVEVLDVLEDAVFERPADRDVIEQRDVLHVLAKADPAGMWADRHAELGRQEVHRQHLVQAAEAACIQLAEADRLSLEELLADHAILRWAAGCVPVARRPSPLFAARRRRRVRSIEPHPSQARSSPRVAAAMRHP